MERSELITPSNILRPLPLDKSTQLADERKSLERLKTKVFWYEIKSRGSCMIHVVGTALFFTMVIASYKKEGRLFRLGRVSSCGFWTLVALGGVLIFKKYRKDQKSWTDTTGDYNNDISRTQSKIDSLISQNSARDLTLPSYSNDYESPFSKLPNDLLLQIIIRLNGTTLTTFFCSDKRASLWANCEGFWKQKLKRDFPHVGGYLEQSLDVYKKHYSWLKKVRTGPGTKCIGSKYPWSIFSPFLFNGNLCNIFIQDGQRWVSGLKVSISSRGTTRLSVTKGGEWGWGDMLSFPVLAVRAKNGKQVVVNQEGCSTIENGYNFLASGSCWRYMRLHASARYIETSTQGGTPQSTQKHLLAYPVYTKGKNSIFIYNTLSHSLESEIEWKAENSQARLIGLQFLNWGCRDQKGIPSLLVATRKSLDFYSLATSKLSATILLTPEEIERCGKFASCTQVSWKGFDYLVVATTKGYIRFYNVNQKELSWIYKIAIKDQLESIAMLIGEGAPLVFVEAFRSLNRRRGEGAPLTFIEAFRSLNRRRTVSLWELGKPLQEPLWSQPVKETVSGMLQLFETDKGYPVLTRIKNENKWHYVDLFNWDKDTY